MKDKETINLRLYTAVVLFIIFILIIIYMIMFGINRYKAKNKEMTVYGRKVPSNLDNIIIDDMLINDDKRYSE